MKQVTDTSTLPEDLGAQTSGNPKFNFCRVAEALR